MYRPPPSDFEIYIVRCEAALNHCAGMFPIKVVYLCGDFNAQKIQLLKHTLSQVDFTPILNFPTAEQSYLIFHDKVMDLHSLHIPEKEKIITIKPMKAKYATELTELVKVLDGVKTIAKVR